MYRLYDFPGSAAMAPHALLEELGAPYRLVELGAEGDDVGLDLGPAAS